MPFPPHQVFGTKKEPLARPSGSSPGAISPHGRFGPSAGPGGIHRRLHDDSRAVRWPQRRRPLGYGIHDWPRWGHWPPTMSAFSRCQQTHGNHAGDVPFRFVALSQSGSAQLYLRAARCGARTACRCLAHVGPRLARIARLKLAALTHRARRAPSTALVRGGDTVMHVDYCAILVVRLTG